MGAPLAVHVAAGLCGITTGFIALSAAKGGTLHRRSGLLFVYTMVLMALLGAAIAAVEQAQPNPKSGLPATVLMGVFTAYLVVTALTAVRRPGIWSRRLDIVGMLVAACVGTAHLTLGTRALVATGTHQYVILTVVEFIFGAIALLAATSDLHVIRFGPRTGAKRIARHLWRMSLALWVAAFSFSPRLSKYLPVPLRSLVMVPGIMVLVVMFYWMWRVRFRKSFRGLIGVTAPSAERLTSSAPSP